MYENSSFQRSNCNILGLTDSYSLTSRFVFRFRVFFRVCCLKNEVGDPFPPFFCYMKASEVKASIVNQLQQSLVYHLKCDLCDAGYVGYTQRHLHQHVDEHKNASSSTAKHFRVKHSLIICPRIYQHFHEKLNFRKIKAAQNPTYRIFLNCAKNCVLSWLSNADSIKKFHRAVFEL